MMVSFDTNIYPTLSTTKNFAPRLMSCARGNVTSVALSFTQPADTLTGIASGSHSLGSANSGPIAMPVRKPSKIGQHHAVRWQVVGTAAAITVADLVS
jgi:hypothetical protein